jgi:thiamine biosynthesis protein ThiS
VAGLFYLRFQETTMDIQLNGKQTSVAEKISIGELIRGKELDPSKIVVEYNRAIVPAEQWDAVRLKESDVLEILKFVGGG